MAITWKHAGEFSALGAVAAGLLIMAPVGNAEPDQQCGPQQQPASGEQQQCPQQQSLPGLPQLPGNNSGGNSPSSNGIDLGSPNCLVVDGTPMIVQNGDGFYGSHDIRPCWAVYGVTPHG